MKKERIRSGWTLDGQRIILEHDEEKALFVLGTRWVILAKFHAIQDACDAFEALEMLEGNPADLAKHLKAEIKRVPLFRSARNSHAMARVVDLVRSVEMRVHGFRPVACGAKLSVIKWV